MKKKTHGINRRNFIKGSMAAVALASIPDISIACTPSKILPFFRKSFPTD